MNDELRVESPLDLALDASAPPTSSDTVQRAPALKALAREVPTQTSRRRHRKPLVLGGVIGVLMLGFGGAAAASAFDWHSPWADDAAAEVTYTLPSGAVCTGIIGNFKGEDEAVAAAEALMRQPKLIKTLDIDAALAEIAVHSPHTGRWDRGFR